jgi:hypothetical protein
LPERVVEARVKVGEDEEGGLKIIERQKNNFLGFSALNPTSRHDDADLALYRSAPDAHADGPHIKKGPKKNVPQTLGIPFLVPFSA